MPRYLNWARHVLVALVALALLSVRDAQFLPSAPSGDAHALPSAMLAILIALILAVWYLGHRQTAEH
jgi:hypothetical protein